MAFIGRQAELALLQRVVHKRIASLLVIRGRRRIGKSRLIEFFARSLGCTFYHFAGIPPTDKTTAQTQRDEFADQLHLQGFPRVTATDWNDLFWLLADRTAQGQVIILFDEISWMGSKDPDFLGKLKNAWDIKFKKNPALTLVLCGSASSWIQKNILSSTGFVGRISQTLTLSELPLADCAAFWGPQSPHVAAIEKFKLLSVTGGVPRYLEEIDPTRSAETNIRHLCFTPGALLVNEFDQIFSDLFLRDSELYRKLVTQLATGSKSHATLCEALNVNSSGRLAEYLNELTLAGFVRRDYTWHFKTGQEASLSQFRLCDNYLRFYLKYISPHKMKIDQGVFEFDGLSALKQWPTIMGLQFGNLILNNRSFIWKQLGLSPRDIIADNPYFQNRTVKQPGCQIDYLIQTQLDVLFLCEIKLSRHRLSGNVVVEVKEKMERFKRPRGFSCRPVLIHVNGVEDAVIDSGYFSAIIDMSEALNNNASR